MISSRPILSSPYGKQTTGHRTPAEPRRPSTCDGGGLPHRRRELHPRQHIEHGHPLAIRAATPAESDARRAPCAHLRRSRRFVLRFLFSTSMLGPSPTPTQWPPRHGRTSSAESRRVATSWRLPHKRDDVSPSLIKRSKGNRA